MRNRESMTAGTVAGLFVAGVMVAGLAARAETYYANGGGSSMKIGASTCYLWTSADNWQVKDANDNLVTAASAPQQGDTVIFNKAISYMSAYPDGTRHPGLQKVQFNVKNTIHQGYVSLQAGGEGLVLNFTDSMGWWAGVHIAGTGEVPIVVPAGATFKNQKGVRTTSKTTDVTLVKQGAGIFNTAAEGANIYNPLSTKIQGGTIIVRSTEVSNGHELVFDSNDPDIRLSLCNYHHTGNNTDDFRDWTINDGALLESAEVDNTAHGITSDGYDSHLYYLRLTGTPKLAEQRFTGQLYATAGIAFLPGAKTNGNDFVFTFAKAVSSAGGGISVTNGTVRLVEGASFTALRRLDVGPTGTFKVESGSGAGFVCEDLDVASGGRLDLASGVNLCFRKVKAGGSDVPDGVYTSANASWITGDGQVTVNADVDYIILTVGSGTTTYLPEALEAYNAAYGDNVTFASMNGGADKMRTLVKRGAGQLSLTNAMASYEGTIRVEEGILYSNVKDALGKAPNDLHPIIVCTNAQYKCYALAHDYNANRIFRISGRGPNDASGAIYLQNGTMAQSSGKLFGLAGMAGKSVVLEGDAAVYTATPYHWVTWPTLTLGGHDLTFRGNTPDTPQLVGTVSGDGELYVTNTSFRMNGLAFVNATANHTLHVGKGGEFRFVGNTVAGAAMNKWSMEFAADASAVYGCYDLGTYNEAINNFTIPVTLNGLLGIRCQVDRYIAHVNTDVNIEGPGGFKTTTLFDNKYYSSWLRLRVPNSFTGGFQFDRGVIWSYCDGGIPSAGGPVQLIRNTATYKSRCEYDGVVLPKAGEVYSLPELQVSGAHPARIQGGEGAWTKIVKEGANTLEYYSEVGAPLVEVRAGTLKLPRGAAPGLWQGIAVCSSAAEAQSAFNGSAVSTNHIVRGPYMASMRERDNVSTWSQKSLVTYKGYVWNRTGTDVTWTFASSLRDQMSLFIDGSPVLSGAADARVSANVTLTPGPHDFEWRAWNGADNTTGPYKPSGWADNFGFVYDAQGRNDTSSTNNFALATDNGDGALFTRYTNTTERLPVFGTMAFDEGARLDLNGNAYVANEIMGWPVVTNTCVDATSAAALTITNSFTVDGASLAVGRQMASSVPVTFAPGATVTLTNTALIVRNGQSTFPILKAPSLNWNQSKLRLDGRFWVVRHHPESNSLTLEYTAGTYMILR